MLWIIAALASAAIVSAVNIVDSHLLSKKMPGVSAYLLPVGLTHLLIAIVLLIVFPLPPDPGVMTILVACGAGLVNGAGAVLMMNALRQGEVSRVIPVISSSPIFVALLSPILGETISFLGWLGIVLTVAGAILVSLQREGKGHKTGLHKSFILLVLSCLMFAVSSIGYKYSMETISFWNMYSINGICVALIFIIISARQATFTQLRTLNNRNRTLGLTIINQCVVVAGIILSFVAIENGPVSLASAIMNIRPALVFVFALVISRFHPDILNEQPDKSTIWLKIIAIAVITGGVVIISLSG